MLKKIATAAAVALAVGFTAGAQAQDKLKVGFIAVGPKTDGGWTQGHWTGVEMLQKELGDQIEVTFIENVAEGPDAERAIEGLVQAGNKLIFTTSFGFMEPTLKVAAKYPDVKFEHATGFTAKRLLQSNRLTWVVVGDRKVMEAEVRALNFGEVTIVDIDGNPAAAP